MRDAIAAGWVVTIVACALAAPPALAKKDKLNISVVLDDKSLEGKPDLVGSAWIGYAMARANWISDQVKAKSIDPKSYVRSFEEELAGRDSLVTIWREFKEKDPTLADPYLDQLEKVKEAGFLREYVWANLRAPAWTAEPPDLRHATYEAWAMTNLAGHVVETHADARIQNAEAK